MSGRHKMTAAFLFGDTAASSMMCAKIHASQTPVEAYDDKEVRVNAMS